MWLRVGELLHSYVLRRLEEGMPVSRESRPTRENIIRDAASTLNMKIMRVHCLLHTAMAAKLLFTGLDLGDVPWSVVRLFNRAVQRNRIQLKRLSRRPGDGKEDPIKRELWHVVSGTPHPARRAMVRILSEKYNWHQARAYLKTVKLREEDSVAQQKPGNYHHPNNERRSLPTPEIKRHVSFQATPRDLAETVAGMILGNADPAAVLERLLAVEGFARLLKTVRV